MLVPTPVTRAEEVDAAELVAPDLAAALELLLGTGWLPDGGPVRNGDVVRGSL